MPEKLEFTDYPKDYFGFQVEPFREEYIPGSRVLCRELIDFNKSAVFFQIPTPTVQKMSGAEIKGLINQVHEWWQTNLPGIH